MDHLEKLVQIREATDFIISGMMSGCVQMSAAATDAYRELVDQFYFEHNRLMSPEQYISCRQDFEYFLSFIDLAVAQCRDEGGG
jgi:hypothetical protein